MATPDKTIQTMLDLIYPFQDSAHKPLPIPAATATENPLSSTCLNRAAWGYIVGMLERLLYADAWDTDDESVAQDAINYVLDIINEIGQFEECANMQCPDVQCSCCETTNIFQEFNNFTSYQYQNNSFQDVITNNFNMSIAAELNMTIGDVAKELADKVITDQMICTASHLFLSYLHDIGTISSEELLVHNPTFQLFREVSDLISEISALGAVVAAIFPGAQPAAAPLAVLAAWTAMIDDVAVFAAAELFSELNPELIPGFACKLYEQMIEPGAGYAEFAATTFGLPAMDSLWADAADPKMYAAWLALLDNEGLNLDFDCCTNCTVYYPTHEQIIHGIPNSADPRVLQTEETGSGSSLTKQATVKINFDTPRNVRKVSMWCIGKRYHPLGLNYQIRSKRDSEGYTDMVHADGSAWVNNDLNAANVYFAPESQVSALTPAASSWTLNITYASCQACSPSELASYASAYGLMFAITICWE